MTLFALYRKLLCHICDIDISFYNIVDHVIYRFFVFFFFEIRSDKDIVRKLLLCLLLWFLPKLLFYFPDFCRSILCDSVCSQISFFFMTVFNNINIIKSQYRIRNFDEILFTGWNSL